MIVGVTIYEPKSKFNCGRNLASVSYWIVIFLVSSPAYVVYQGAFGLTFQTFLNELDLRVELCRLGYLLFKVLPQESQGGWLCASPPPEEVATPEADHHPRALTTSPGFELRCATTAGGCAFQLGRDPRIRGGWHKFKAGCARLGDRDICKYQPILIRRDLNLIKWCNIKYFFNYWHAQVQSLNTHCSKHHIRKNNLQGRNKRDKKAMLSTSQTPMKLLHLLSPLIKITPNLPDFFNYAR